MLESAEKNSWVLEKAEVMKEVVSVPPRPVCSHGVSLQLQNIEEMSRRLERKKSFQGFYFGLAN